MSNHEHNKRFRAAKTQWERERMTDPVYRAKRYESNRRRRKDPVIREAQRAYMKNYRRPSNYVEQRRAEYLQLKSNPCTDCGLKFAPCAMQFDHVAGEKVGQLSDMILWSREKFLAELAKCELVCANCHAVRTFNRKQHLRLLEVRANAVAGDESCETNVTQLFIFS